MTVSLLHASSFVAILLLRSEAGRFYRVLVTSLRQFFTPHNIVLYVVTQVEQLLERCEDYTRALIEDY